MDQMKLRKNTYSDLVKNSKIYRDVIGTHGEDTRNHNGR